MGESNEPTKSSGLSSVLNRRRSSSNMSLSSSSSMASYVSDNSTQGDSTQPNLSHDDGSSSSAAANVQISTATKSSESGSRFLQVKSQTRSRSQSRGRKQGTSNFYEKAEEKRSRNANSRSRTRIATQGPIYQILNNFKPFSRESREGSRSEQVTSSDAMPQSPTDVSNTTPLSSYRGSIDLSSTSDSDESFVERGRKPHRRTHASERGDSPSHWRLKIFPPLSNLVTGGGGGGSANPSDQAFSAGIIAESARRMLTRRSRSTSASRPDSQTVADVTPPQPPTSAAASISRLSSMSARKRQNSSSTIKSQNSASGERTVVGQPSSLSLRQESTAQGSSESESLRHAELPTEVNTVGPTSLSQTVSGTNRNAHDDIEYKRQRVKHTKNPSFGQLDDSPSAREKLCFVRVYRPDGTFGTIACPIDTTTERLQQLAARKFFITDASDFHLVALSPDRVRILGPESKPAQLIRDLLIRAGYHSTMDKLNDVSRDDTSFLCRIVLTNINEPLRPPLLMQGLRDLVLVNSDVVDAPSIACNDPRHVETLDVSGSAFQGTASSFPKLKHLRITNMLLLDDYSTGLAPQVKSLMTNLTRLDLSGNGVTNLDGIDFMEAPNLKHLDLRGNQLTELPKTLLHLPFLEVLLCGTNALSQFDIWNPSLCTLDLSYNKLSRLILREEQALQMVNLASLQLCANSLDALPDSLHLLPALKELDVRHNMIVHPIEALTPSLHRLVASYNNPSLAVHHDSSSSIRNSSELNKDHVKLFPNIRQLKLAGLHVLEIRETFMMEKITFLDLRNTHLSFIDESLFQQAPNLQTLNLSSNSLTRLPVSIGHLLLLEELYVSNNSLVELPPSLFELQELRTLDVHANNLKILTQGIILAPKLRTLNLASNLIASLPSAEGSNLSPLIQLILCDNQLTEDSFESIMQLTTLRILDLGYNYFSELPSGLFYQLSALEELFLSGNRISTLPHDEFVHATRLRVLRVNGNRLNTLPAELSKATNLEILDVAANQLRYNVANWPFDWNWRWNKKLRYLNFSSNKRLEIRKSLQFVDDATGVVDLADLCVLPQLTTLGLMDVTLTTNAVPFQTENCRVRTFGSDLHKFKVGIAESLGFRPLANNDLVVERFRGRDDEFLVAIFDGQNEYPGSGNLISHLAQDTFASMLRREMQSKDTTTVDALRCAFLATHREIGNTALLSSEEIAHTPLGHRSSTASRLGPRDWSAGTGATVVYFQGKKLYVATVGGARVILSRANGTHSVLSKPLPPVSGELDRIRSSGGIVNPAKSYVNDMSAFPRLIGCYTEGTVFSAAPSIYEYEFETIASADQIIIGSSTMWEVLRHETAADIVRSSAQDPVSAAMKLRDFTSAYGMRDRMMALVIGSSNAQPPDYTRHSSGDIHDDKLVSIRRRRQSLPEDSTLARLGTEVSPPFGEVTMVFTDIKNSTLLWESYPSVMRAAIKTHNSLMRRSIRLMDGYEVKNEGDAFIISFHTPVKALIWCLTVQQHLLTAEWPPELLEVDECAPVRDDKQNIIFRGLSVRMGIHCGRPVAEPDPVTKRMDYFGPMVNRASRISGIALGGQISVSADFLNTLQRDLAAHKRVKEGIPLEQAYDFTTPASAMALERSATVLDHTEHVVMELGELKLRGIENPEHIYNIYPLSLASRQKFYDEHDTGERQSHSEIRPVIISRPGGGAAVSNSPSVAPSLAGPLVVTDPDSNDADITGNTTHVLSGTNLSALVGSSGTDGFSTPGSPFVSPVDQERRRSSDAASFVSRQSTRSIDYRDARDLRIKHSMHLNPHITPTHIIGDLDQLVSTYNDQLRQLSRRLESICVAYSSGLKLQSVQEVLQELESPIQSDPENAEVALLLWVTRIENAIARLQQQLYGLVYIN